MQNTIRRLIKEKYLSIQVKLVIPFAITILLLVVAISPLGNKLLLTLTVVFGLATVWFWITAFRTFTRSLTQLKQVTTKMSQGDLNQNVDTSYLLFKDEITILSENINSIANNLSNSYTSLEENVKQRTQELAEARDAAISANRSKSEFVSTVSHELKIPMTSIKGYSDLMLSGATGQLNENQTSFLTTIRTNVNRMATL